MSNQIENQCLKCKFDWDNSSQKCFQVGVLVSTEGNQAKPSAQLVWEPRARVLDELIRFEGVWGQSNATKLQACNFTIKYRNQYFYNCKFFVECVFSKTTRLFEWTNSIGFTTCKSNKINIETAFLHLYMFCWIRFLQTTICLCFRLRQCTKHLRFHEFNGFKRFHYIKSVFNNDDDIFILKTRFK